MIERICQQCGNSFFVKPSKAYGKRGKFCSTVCQHQSMRGKPLPVETKEKMSIAHKGHSLPWLKGRPLSEEHKHKLSIASKIAQSKVEARQKNSEGVRRAYRENPELREKVACSSKKRWQDPEYKLRVSKATSIGKKVWWQDPNNVLKMVKSWHLKPTKPELKLEIILFNYFPQYKYNGDGRLGIVLGGLIPDFVNTNGKKEVIEVFGNYWHRRENLKWHQTELGRIMHYNSLGYRCLIIWEHQLDEKYNIIKLVKNLRKAK